MKLKYIKEINKLKDKVQLKKVIDLYRKEKLTTDDIINPKSGLEILPNIINGLALKIDNGEDELNKDESAAFKLYDYAAQQGDGWAKYNVAYCYFCGSGTKKDVDKAIELLTKAIAACSTSTDDVSLKSSYNSLLGEAYFAKESFKKSFDYFRLVNQEDTDDYQSAQQSIQKILKKQLISIYDKLNAAQSTTSGQVAQKEPAKGPATPAEKSTEVEMAAAAKNCERAKQQIGYGRSSKGMAETDKRAPGWFTVSHTLDGYDPTIVHKVIADMELKKAELLAMPQASSIGEVIEKAKKEKWSSEIIKALEKEKTALINQEIQANETFRKAKETFTKLINGAELKELRRQIQTEKHYFSPHRTREVTTRAKAKQIQKNRLIEDEKTVIFVDVTDIPARRIVTSELSVIEASLSLYGRGDGGWYSTCFGWHTAQTQPKAGYYISSGNREKVKLGAAELCYRQRTNPHVNHVGDYYMEDLGDYRQIIKTINQLTGTTDETIKIENEEKLALYMLRYSKNGQPIVLEELRQIYSDTDEERVTSINRILYHCFVKEIVRWMQPKDSEHELPFATAQIRAVKLITLGFLSMQEVFSQDASYGVYTEINVGNDIPLVKEKILRINRLYDEAILKHKADEFPSHMSFFKEHKDGRLVPTRKELHLELQDSFGGSSDSDGEGYDSDTAEKMYPEAFKFD